MATFDFVVSTENQPYVTWQAMLFHYTCAKHMERAPIVVVHGNEGEELMPGYDLIRERGGRVQRARNFRNEGPEYEPRNTPGSLECVESDADYLVLCDPDMLFLRRLPLGPLRLRDDQVSFELASYLVVDDENAPALERPCRITGVELDALRARPIPGGVPHVVPAALREPLARDWLECLEAFAPEPDDDARIYRLASMWALVLATHRLGLGAVLTTFGATNFEGDRPAPPSGPEKALLHYCYGDEEFDKRDFTTAEDERAAVWRSVARPGTVNATICAELRAAGEYFGLV